MKWTLYIGHTDGSLMPVDLAGDLYITFKANDVGDPTAYYADYSQQVELLKTERTLQALGISAAGESYSDITTHAWPCVIEYDGTPLSSHAFSFIVLSVTDTSINGQLVSSYDIWQQLENDDFTQSIYDDFTKTLNTNTMATSTVIDDVVTVRWMWSQNDIQPGRVDPNTANGTATVYGTYPHVNFQQLVQYLVSKQVISGGAWQYVEPLTFSKRSTWFVVAANPTMIEGSGDWTGRFAFNASASVNVSTYTGMLPIPLFTTSGISGNADYRMSVSDNNVTACVAARTGGTMAITYSITPNVDIFASPSDGPVLLPSVSIYADGRLVAGRTDTTSYIGAISSGRNKTYVVGPFSVNAGEQVRISLHVYSLNATAAAVSLSGGVKVTQVVTDEDAEYGVVPLGSEYNILRALNFANAKELVTAYMNAAALFPVVDTQNRTIYGYSMAEVVNAAKAGNGVDWTDKLMMSEDVEISYESPGSPVNVNYEDLDDKPRSFQFANFGANTNGESMDIDIPVALPLGISSAIRGNAGKSTIANYPIYNVSNGDGGGIVREYAGVDKPLVVLSSSNTKSGYIPDGYTTVGAQRNVAKTLFTATPIGDETIQAAWEDYIFAVLLYPMKLTATFDLTLTDINTLDFSKPVWLSQYNAWFYLQAVNNYSGGPCECELMKLNLNY